MNRQTHSYKKDQPWSALLPISVAGVLFLLLAGVVCLVDAAEIFGSLEFENELTATDVFDPQPLWQSLSDMDARERKNAHIQLEAFDTHNTTLQHRVLDVAGAWNRGDYEPAIVAVKLLEARGYALALGISWKSPPAVRKVNGAAISAHGNSFNPHLDAHNGSGNVFIATQDSDTSHHWRVYFSNDGGQSWTETYYWNSSVPIVDISATVVGNYFYVSYVASNNPGSARVRRCLNSTGAADSSFGSGGWLEIYNNSTADVTELALASNQEGANHRLYLISILSDGSLEIHFSDEDGGAGDLEWSTYPTGITNAAGNLDIGYNDQKVPGSPGGFLFAVYRANDNGIDVCRFLPALAVDVRGIAPYFTDDPAISAYRDRAVIVHTYDAPPRTGLRYWFTEDAGDSWSYGFLDYGGYGDVNQPDVTLRRGGGIVVTYQRDSSPEDFLFMRTRVYGDETWSEAVQVSDVGLTVGTDIALEALPEGSLGLVSFHTGGIPWYDQTPLIFRNSFELGDTLDWD